MKWVFTYEQIAGRRWDVGSYATKQEAEEEKATLERRSINAGLYMGGIFLSPRKVTDDYNLSPHQIELGEEMPKVLTLGKEFDSWL